METDYLAICSKALEWARVRDYKGYGKFDALNSPLLRTLSMNRRLLRGAFIFGMSRMPVNVRPVFFVRKTQNPKGLALFARCCFNLYNITGNKSFLDEGLQLLNVLLSTKQDKYSGHCWGYDYPWQSIAFFIPPYEPNCVVTCAVAAVFMQAYELTGKAVYLDICQSVADFILKDLNQIDVGPKMLCISYDLRSSWKVINVNALASAFLANLYRLTQKEACKNASQALMAWVISKKTDYHAWYYADPPETSRITHDNYHTGFVLDSIQDYLRAFPDSDIEKAWQNGLDFYRAKLFTAEGAPKWMYNRQYPHDIHGAAQGIITFVRVSKFDHACLNLARKILDWTLANLYSPSEERFYYQKTKYWVRKFTLMRWSQAWMTYAMSCFLLHSKKIDNS